MFILEVMILNIVVTSREAILKECRKMVMEKGITAINMRSVAAACGVAVGSIYNYFPSKADLITASVEEVWKDIFHMSDKFEFEHITDCLEWIFYRIKEGCIKYPGFFTLHSMSFTAEDKEKGRKMMEKYFGHVKQNMKLILEKDHHIREDAFNEILTKDVFVDLMFSIITSMLLQNKDEIKPLLEMVSRSIY